MVCGNKKTGEYSVWKMNPSFKVIVLTVILTFRFYFSLGRVDFFPSYRKIAFWAFLIYSNFPQVICGKVYEITCDL